MQGLGDEEKLLIPVVLDKSGEACSSQPVEEGAAGNWEHQQHDIQAACPSAASSEPAHRCSTVTAQQQLSDAGVTLQGRLGMIGIPDWHERL